MSKATTNDPQPSARTCPWWCDGVTGHEGTDGGHYSDGQSMPIAAQLKGEMMDPDVHVSLAQAVEGKRVHQPLLHLVGGTSNEMTPDQARDLIRLTADQLALLDRTLVARPEPCPPWCVRVEQHEEELQEQGGGALHWGPCQGGAGKLDVRIAAVTDADGIMPTGYPVIHVGDETLSATEARTLAFALLHAAALADIADGVAAR